MLAAAIPWESLGCAVCGVAYDGVQGMRLLESAAIRMSEDHRQLYLSNRGHGSIAVYSILQDGSLTPSGWFMEAGSFPCDFILLKDGRILVADQRAGVRLLDGQGRMIDFLPHVGAVCIGAI